MNKIDFLEKLDKHDRSIQYLGEFTDSAYKYGLYKSHDVYNFYYVDDKGTIFTIYQTRNREEMYTKILNYFGYKTSLCDKLKTFVSRIKNDHDIEHELKSHYLPCYYDRIYSLDYIYAHIYACSNYCINFSKPECINEFEMFEILSYIVDRIDFVEVSNVLAELGFDIIEENIDDMNYYRDVIKLFIVNGNKKIFSKTEEYNDYFNWYIPGVSEEEYSKLASKIHENKQMIYNLSK